MTAVCASNVYYKVSNCYLFAEPSLFLKPLWMRIGKVAFHILTLGVPLAIYQLANWCFSRVQKSQIEAFIKTLSPQGQKAVADARAALARNPGILGTEFDLRATNPEIVKLDSLYWRCYCNFSREMKEHESENPWENEGVINAADQLMAFAYATSILTLEDLGRFTQKHSRTSIQTLNMGGSIHSLAFLHYAMAYHLFRGATPCPAGHREKFYIEGTRHHIWNVLYNECCDRIQQFVSVKALYEYEGRYVNDWTQRDSSEEAFKPRNGS